MNLMAKVTTTYNTDIHTIDKNSNETSEGFSQKLIDVIDKTQNLKTIKFRNTIYFISNLISIEIYSE